MSGSSHVFDWQRIYGRDKKEGTRPNAQRMYPTKRIQNYRNVGVHLLGIIPNWCDSKKSSWSKFPYQRLLSEERLMQEFKSGRLFGDVQCDLKVPEHLKAYFANFPPFFKNAVVSKNDIGDLIKEYVEKEGILSQPRKKLISSFHLKNGTIITPLLIYYFHLGLECTKFHQFVQYSPKKCFNSFVQSAVNARRQEDENPNSSVVAATMKFLANNSYGYQIKDRSRQTVTKFLNEEMTHSAIKIKLFKRLNFITHHLYEVELVKSKIEHREAIIVGFFILQYAQLRMLQFFYNYFKKFCDTEKYEELEMDTDSLYWALSEENLEYVIFPEKRNEWEAIRSRDCTDSFTANATGNFFTKTCCTATKSMIRENRDCLKKNSGVPKCCACVAKPVVAAIERVTNTNSAARDSIKELWKTVEMDPYESIANC